ncbi:hypothetical protein T492DRAFT_1014933 [Pavlovales sp. CCMP2436]|nr:hypothetical protein T492DRAFT_1014933 [Pavlovales sp. CCMP2436]
MAPAPSAMAAARPRVGVHFPLQLDGSVSTTKTLKAVWCAAALAAGQPDLAAAIDREKAWRHRYTRHVVALAAAMAASRECSLAGAIAGLAELDAALELVPPAGPLATGLGLRALHANT